MKVFTYQRELLQNIAGCGNDMAADRIGLNDIEQLARARPDQLHSGMNGDHFHGRGHERYGIAARVGDTAGEHRDAGRSSSGQSGGHTPDLIERQERRDIEADPSRERRQTRSREGSLRVFVTGILT